MHKAINILAFSFLYLIISLAGYSTTYTTTDSGDWETTSTWVGGIAPPTTISNSDIINISVGHSVTLESTLVFNNNCDLNIDGELYITGSVEVNNNLNLVVTGSFIIDGSFSAHNGAVVDVDGDMTITGDCDFHTGADLAIDGVLTIEGDFEGHMNNELTGSGDVNVNGTITGVGTSGYTGTVNESVSAQIGLMNNGAVIHVGINAVIYVDGDGSGDFTNVSKTGSIGEVDLDGIIIIEGDWNNYTSDSVLINVDDNGTVKLAGTTSQIINGSNPTNFESLTIDNTSNVSINENIVVNKTLTLSNGYVTTGTSDTVIIENTAVTAIVSQAEGKSINGNLRRYLQAGSFDFPISTSAQYLAATIDISDMGAMSYLTGSFTVSSGETVPADLNVNGTPITEFLDYGYWTFTPDNGSGVEYDITLISNGHLNGGSLAEQHAILKKTGIGDWVNDGDHANGTQSGSGTDAITVKRSNLTGFSDFIIGKSAEAPLSVELINFEANCSGENVVIQWQTATEFNNAEFVVQHSIDGETFSSIGNIQGAGDSYIIVSYKYIHESPEYGINYYRLKQIDYDGIEVNSPIISSQCRFSTIKDYKTYLESGKLIVEFNTDYKKEFTIKIYDPLGRNVHNIVFLPNEGYNKLEFNIDNGQPGLYLVELSNEHEKKTEKIITHY